MTRHADLPIVVSILSSRMATDAGQMPLTWHALAEGFKNPDPRGSLGLVGYLAADRETKAAEKDGIGWMPCSIREGGKRCSEDVVAIYAMVLDFDNGTPIAAIEEKLKDYEYVLHTTYSHIPEHPKCRVILPFTEPVAPTQLPAIFDTVNGWFDGKIDRACGHNPAGFYYWPSCPKDAVEHFVHRHNAGRLLDPNEVSTVAVTATLPTPSELSSADDGPPDFTKGYSDGERTRQLTWRAGYCIATGMSVEETIEKCLVWNRHNTPPLEEKKVIATCKSIMKTDERRAEVEEAKTLRKVDELNAKYAWVQRYSEIFRFEFGDFINQSNFRGQYANVPVLVEVDGKLKWRTLAEAWIRSPRRRQHRDVDYMPGKPGIFDDRINFWSGWGCEPIAGPIEPWCALLDYIFAGDVDARKWFEQWIAYPFQHPGAKLNCAAVIWSARQGVGKTLVGETIGKLYGKDNFKTISAAELHGSFNGWAKRCQFVLGEENASSDHRADSNRLKHLITGETMTVNEKYQPAITLENRMNFIFTSNNPDAFHLETFDRRFFVWEIASEPLAMAFYADFADWRDNRGGREALMHHFKTLDLTGFNPKAPAPMTSAKLAMLETSRSDLERWLAELTEDPALVVATVGKEIVTLDELVKCYNAKGGTKANTTSVGKALQRLGPRDKRRLVVKRGRPWLLPICRVEHWEREDSPSWVRDHDKPTSLTLMRIAA
jgi:hypothetical protein